MQLYVIILMMGLMAYRDIGYRLGPVPDTWMVLTLSIAPFAVVAMVAWFVYRLTLGAIRRNPGRTERMLFRLRVFNVICHWAMAMIFLADLFVVGWLAWLEQGFGKMILVNDLIALSPVVVALVTMWAAYYPIDRHLRGEHADDGGAWPRLRFVLSQVRHQLMLMLVPLLVLLGWLQIVDRYIDAEPQRTIAFVAGLMVVFMLAPVMIRFVWDTAPLPAGELRDRLMDLCARYRVRVRALLMWRTHGGIVNGAVMGIVGRLRYILLTDGLIARMDPEHVEAVMAHELGHVARRHIPWLLICAAASLGVVVTIISGVQAAAIELGWITAEATDELTPESALIEVPVLVVLTLGFGLVFGYISRRFERQADTFAVQHMTERHPDPDNPGVITAEAVAVVTDSLTRVAVLNHIPLDKPATIWEAMTPMNWRHGSIPWRIAYLRSLVGIRVDDCAIDRKVRRIRWACAAILAAVIALGGGAGM